MKKKKKSRSAAAPATPAPKLEAHPANQPRSVRVGDIVQRTPVSFSEGDVKNAGPMRGRVVYVHPNGRFHIVEFDKGVRESFAGVV